MGKSGLWYPKEEYQKYRDAYEAGKIEGLLKAYINYYEYPDDIKLPKWVRDALYNELTILLNNLQKIKTGKPGPGGNQESRERYDAIHLQRWKIIRTARSQGLKGEKLWAEVNKQVSKIPDNKARQTLLRSEKIVNDALLDPLQKGRFVATLNILNLLNKKY